MPTSACMWLSWASVGVGVAGGLRAELAVESTQKELYCQNLETNLF